MNVASLKLCEKLYKLSGWQGAEQAEEDTEGNLWFNSSVGWQLVADARFTALVDEPGDWLPAYDAGYLLRKFPRNIQIDESIGWLTLAGNAELWQCGYLMDGGYMGTRFNDFGNTPEDALCKLAIELFKEGVLDKEKS